MLSATLVTDGSSDSVLTRALEWLLGQHTDQEFEIRWADLRLLRHRPSNLSERLQAAIEIYPCRLLFVHRDAEAQNPNLRYQEIAAANLTQLPHVCVVPVRMQEAWLLHDERALREAAGRPSGSDLLSLPPISRFERIVDPKDLLHAALRTASGASGRRARTFKPARAAHRLAELITDWSPLRKLGAFERLETDVIQALSQL